MIDSTREILQLSFISLTSHNVQFLQTFSSTVEEKAKWIFNKLIKKGRVGIVSARELSQHRLHTTKYEDLCM